MSDASVIMLIGAGALAASASLISWKAVVAAVVHCSSRLLGAVNLSIELSGVKIVAQCGINR